MKKFTSYLYILSVLMFPLQVSAFEEMLKADTVISLQEKNSHTVFNNIISRSHLKTKQPKKFVTLQGMTGMGFFEEFLSILGALYIYELGQYAGVRVDLCNNKTYYDPAYRENWWEYYFEPLCVGNPKNTIDFKTVNGEGDSIDYARHVEFCVYRSEANALIKKYIHVKKEIKKKLRNFTKKHFGKDKVIGVHFRGTDKYSEAPIAKFEKVTEYIDKAIASFKKSFPKRNIKIFVATDEQSFLEYIISRYPSQIVFYEEGTRSLDGSPVHTSLENSYKKGEDALFDCLLLSKCHYLIKTSSNLSLCAAYFNPKMPMVHVTVRPWRAPLE